MGCDIHICVEKKENKQWIYMPESMFWGYEGADNRMYKLFAKLADVRNDGEVEPLSKPKGLPQDASDSTLMAYSYTSPDNHSTSYFSAGELKGVDWSECHEYSNGIKHSFVERLIPEMLLHCEEDDNSDVRVVFWFDN
jgi:hypothetical protein